MNNKTSNCAKSGFWTGIYPGMGLASKGMIAAFVVFTALTVTIPAHAVYVKYRGKVDIYNGYFRPFSLKPSSFVHGIHYDENNRYLVVKLSRTYYHYCRIPSYVVEMWVSASSLGRFYNRYIKGNYDCRLGGIPIY